MARHLGRSVAASVAADRVLAAHAAQELRGTRLGQVPASGYQRRARAGTPPRTLTPAERAVQRAAADQALTYPARRRVAAVRGLRAGPSGGGAGAGAAGAAPGTTTSSTASPTGPETSHALRSD